MLRRRQSLLVTFFATFAGLASPHLPAAATGGRHPIVVTSTIQAAVDIAHPGDTIVVPPGVYHETVVVDKDHLTIRGSVAAILDATGFTYGMRVGTGEIAGDPPVCPPLSVHDFTLDGLTIRNADDIGIFMLGVDGFHVTHGRYLDNAEYGVFPRCSRHGLIDFNSGGGGEDATIYVGVDDGVVVEKNDLRNAEIGIELENTLHTIVRNNFVTGNVAGILVVVLPGLPTSVTDDALIEGNVINANNLPNPFPPPPPFFDDLQLLPTGTGILNVGGDHVVIRNNVVTNNDTVGVALVENPFGFGPPDDNVVTHNVIIKNGQAPDPRSALSGDIVYDGSGSGNCFGKNVFKTDAPPGITSLFACP